MNRNSNFGLALVVFIASALLLPLRQASGASLTRVTVTVTNMPVTSNVFYFSSSSGSRLLRWTNAFTSTTIRTNLLGTNHSTTNLFFSIVNYPTLGTTVRYASSNSIVLSGVSMVVTQLGNWCSISTSTLSGTNQYDLALPFDTLPETNRTNNASELVYGINRYATNRTLQNFVFDPFLVQNMTITGVFTTLSGQKVAAIGNIQTNFTITTNQYYIGINSSTGAVLLTLPPADTASNHIWLVHDEYGAASTGTNLITITNTGGTNRIRGALSVGISNNFGGLFLLSRGGTNYAGSRWNVLDPPLNLAVSNATVKPILLTRSGALALEQGSNTVLFLTSTSIVVNAANINTLPELSDVADAFTGLADGQVLTYISAMGKWTNVVAPGASGGEANTGSNLGIGWPTYDSKSVTDLRFNTWTNGAGLLSSSNANTLTMRMDTAIKVDNLLATNAIGRLRSLVSSTVTTQQIDIAAGPTAYYWTNMVTNVVLQVTNVWTAGVTNRSIDFFFTGATNLGPTYTVTFDCPNPAGVNFRWGWNSATNGLTSFSVTNSQRAAAVLTMWETNMGEAYFSIVR